MEKKIKVLDIPKQNAIFCKSTMGQVYCFSDRSYKNLLFNEERFIIKNAEVLLDADGSVEITPIERGKKLVIGREVYVDEEGEGYGYKVIMTEK